MGADRKAVLRCECRLPRLRWRAGLIVCYKAYGQREDALRHLGVTEKELEPIAP
jgi:hypothetical protein